MKSFLTIVSFLLISFVTNGQDRLLLTNGKYKELKGDVVFYDYDQVYYQNAHQKVKMDAYLEKLNARLEAKQTDENWASRQQAKKNKVILKRAEKRKQIADFKANLEAEIKERSKTDIGPDFERWKSAQIAKIKDFEQSIVLDSTLRVEAEELKTLRKEARIRRRFSKEVSRSLVFSILKQDGTEEVIYTADTLGFLIDGDAEREYGVSEMRLYIKGRQDGRKHSFHDVYIGAGVGLISGLVFTYTLDMFYAPIAPAICIAVIAGLRKTKPGADLELDANLLKSDAYMDGYHRSAKGRKILAFTVGAVGGLGIGITTGVLTSPLLR